jgi:hypothetical protein
MLNLANMLQQKAFAAGSVPVFHKNVENLVDFRPGAYAKSRSSALYSSLNHDRGNHAWPLSDLDFFGRPGLDAGAETSNRNAHQ